MKLSRHAKQLENRRIQAVRETLEGGNQREIARRLKVNRTTVNDWVQDYREGGWEALQAKPRPGRPRLLSADQHAQLLRILEAGAMAAGFPDDLWDCRRVADVIRKKFDVDYTLDHVPRILRRLGFTPQRPEYRAYERDEKRIEQWKNRDWPRIKKRQEARGHSRFRR